MVEGGDAKTITVKAEGESFKISEEIAKHVTLFEDLFEQDSGEEIDLADIAGHAIKKY